MKSIIRQFRLSCALDGGQSSANLKARDRNDEQFIRDLAGVEQQLKSRQPRLAAPAELHDAIMDKVRSTEQARIEPSAAPERDKGALGSVIAALQRYCSMWLAPASAAGLVAVLLLAVHFLRHEPALPVPEKPARDLSNLPTTVLSPLSTELENLNRDLQNTTDFLLASVP